MVVAIALGSAFSWVALWVHAPSGYFGGDHDAYREGAARLMETGSPYHSALLSGPIANHVDNVPIGYLYPPLLAQLFAPLEAIPPAALEWAAAVTQAVLLLSLLPLVYRRMAGTLTIDAALFIWLATVVSFPVHIALWGGNMSGWITIVVAIMLISQRHGAGAAAAGAALLKMTPIALAIPALLYRPTRFATIATLLLLGVASVVLAPQAWFTWLTALPNILRFPSGDDTTNFAPSVLLAPYGLGWLGLGVSYAIGGSAAITSIVFAWRGHWPAAVAAAVATLLFATGSTWDHYLAPTLPLVVAVAARQTASARSVFVAFVAMSAIMWFGLGPPDLRRLTYFVVAVLVSFVSIALLAPGPAANRARLGVIPRSVVDE